MKKTSKKILLLAVVFTMLITMVAFSVSAITYNGIANNGKNGISIDIYSEPYTTYANKCSIEYSSVGCTWFAAARVCQLTGKQVTIWDGHSWFSEGRYLDYGFTRGNEPRAKALVCYEEHVEVLEKVDGNIVTVSSGGAGSFPNNDYCSIMQYTVDELKSGTDRGYNRGVGKFLGFIYLDGYVDSWKPAAPVLDFGDNFYARIINLHSGMALGLNGDNVCIKNRANANDQIWLFVKVGTNRYKILNHSNGKALDVWDASGASGANLTAYPDNGSVAQKWGIFGAKENCVLSADCTDCVIDIWDDKYTEGTDVNMHTKHDGKNQRFRVEKIAAPAKPVVSVSASGKNTVFSWGKDAEAVSYSLTVKKDGTAYKTVNSITANTYTMELPNGSYSAVVTAKNFMQNTTASDAKSFTVNNNATENDNWTYAKTLPSGITSDKYEIEYKHTYSQVSKTSPGADWVKGSVAKTDYVNKGDQYSSNLPLSTSNTRALAYTYYYHFCRADGNANFNQTDSFTHFDSIGADKVYEAASAVDGDDSRYTYYHLKYKSDNSDAYCATGVTCDGSYGSHGNRTYLWYKMYVYQDKEAINYYTYTKTEGWTDKKDSSASSFEVRYRPLEEKDPCASGHTYTSKTTKAASCTATGVKTYTCSVCKATKTETIAKLGHKYSSSYTVDKKATCTAAGSKSKHCTRSGCTAKTSVTAIAKTAHTIVTVKGKAASCKATGLTEGKKCSVCGTVTVAQKTIAKKAHTYKTTTTKATLTKNGKSVKKCSVCGYSSSSTIYYPKSIALSTTSYTYNGKTKTPSVTVKDSKSKVLKKDTDYTVKYESGRKSTGKYTVTVTFKGKYTGTKKLYFTIAPNTTSKVTASAKETTVTLKWSKVTGATGYRVFRKSGSKWKTLTDTTKLTYTVKKLKAGTKYTFAVRPYKVDGKDTVFAKTYTTVKATTSSSVPTLKVTSSKKGVASLSWSKISGANGYDIYMSTKKNGDYSYVTCLFSADDVKYTVKKLKSGKTYYFKVRSFTYADSGYVNNDFSAAQGVKIK